jgi:hypothetical protein
MRRLAAWIDELELLPGIDGEDLAHVLVLPERLDDTLDEGTLPPAPFPRPDEVADREVDAPIRH